MQKERIRNNEQPILNRSKENERETDMEEGEKEDYMKDERNI